MISLFGASDVLRIVTTTAASLNAVCAFTTRAADGSISKGRQRTVVSSATTTTVVSAPAAGDERNVYSLSIRNTHVSLSNQVTIQEFDGTTAFERFRVILAPGEQLIFDSFGGWQYLNAQGMPKQSQSQGSSSPAIGVDFDAVLEADVLCGAVSNAIADVTGLSFPVLTGGKFWFEFYIDYTANATATGSRWSINGPAFSRLAYKSYYGLTTTADTINNLAAYDQPASFNASSPFITGNVAWIAGFITPSADGNVIARFASEAAVAGSITAKAGSRVRWKQVA